MPVSSNSESPIEAHSDSSELSSTAVGVECINILLVDDEPKNLTVLETILNDPGYRLVCADSANQALLALVREEFALIVLDIQMPGMTGFELAQMIKQRRKTAGVPIIFLTAYYSEAEHVLEGYGSGAVDYLHKPVNPAILRSKVAVFAALHRTKRATERANEALMAEIAERQRVEEQLLMLNNELEARVEHRTSELTQLHRRKDEFLATLAHELRNPLAPLRNATEILKMNRADARTTQQLTEMMDRQVHHLVRLVDDLLDVSRVMGGKIELHKELVDLASAVNLAIETAQPLIHERRHKLEVKMPSESLIVDADPVRLAQVIGNLLTNSAKYTEPEGSIWVIGERQGDDIVLRVRDSGIGIASELLPRVFELFVQADHATNRSQGGLGIGLTLVKNLVEIHKGSVTAFSDGLGKGSEFVVRLPCAIDCHTATKDERSEPPERQQSCGHQLLVVDDNKAAATTLAMLLRSKGHAVQVAHDGASALNFAMTNRPEMILLDIGMPVMDGYEVARRMRQMHGLENTCLVALTGWGQEEDRRRSEEAGFDHHLVKPADLKELETLLAGLERAAP